MSETAIHLKYMIGIQIQNPTSYGLGFMTIEMPSRTQAEVRRDKLRWKLKVRIAWRNRGLFVICYLPAIVLVAVGVFGLIALIQPPSGIVGTLYGIGFGYLIAQTWILLWYIIGEWFETQPSYIRLKR